MVNLRIDQFNSNEWQMNWLKNLKFGSSVEPESKTLDGSYTYISKYLYWHVYEWYCNEITWVVCYYVL